MKIEQYDKVYFLGIGGIGMSALARWFIKRGLRVCGYDKTSTPLTDELAREGMQIHFDDSVDSIPAEIRADKEKTLVVYTPAIPKDHSEYGYLRDHGLH